MRKRPIMVRIPKNNPYYGMTYRGYIYPARLSMAQHLDRCLGSDEFIYYIDGNSLNSDDSNLQLVSHKELNKMQKIRRMVGTMDKLASQLVVLRGELAYIRNNHIPCSCPKCMRSRQARQAEYKL